ncbi:TonB-dependent receptor [Puteibacter caeruleilacunae]|nr:TonB-dependent receptor [Puteibacter caeruleilacunae]
MKTGKYLVLVIMAIVKGMYVYSSPIDAKYYQTIRGNIVDHDTKQPLPGANVVIIDSDPIHGTASDADGNFILENVPIGRVSLQVSCLGYETQLLSNLEVGTAKELVLHIELTESLTNLGEVQVKAKTAKHETLNKMATVSGQAFTIEEASRYSGSLNDPARAVSAFAGVSSDGEGSNEIIVRGNSPKGIQWRLEGIEIPNPNHFADAGSTGGAVNALNSNMLRNSDFFTGAFTAEYGNAFSGIFDIKFRNGNNAKHEQTFGFSTTGTDFTIEGPVKAGYGGSYLANYRYSSLELLSNAGIVDFDGIPKYQDGSFKLSLPSKKLGNFTVFGLFGKNNMLNTEKNDEETVTLEENRMKADLAVVGLSNLLPLSDKSYIKNTIAWSKTNSHYESKLFPDDQTSFIALREDYQESYLKFQSTLNSKLNARHSLKAGIEYTRLGFEVFNENDYRNTGSFTTDLDSEGNSGLYQAFINWKYRIATNLSLITGVHSQYFKLNDDYTIEPRMGIKYQFTPKQSLSFGFGMHSKLESFSTYFVQLPGDNGFYKPNTDLEMSKARHYVVGYNNQLSDNLHFKIEGYYQYLYDLAVENNPNSKIVLQDIRESLPTYDFVNEGTGKNYGVELTLEKFYNNDFYYLLTGSLYDAKFTALDGTERNSRYNGKYKLDFLFGKEFKVGDNDQNRFGINSKVTFSGAQYYTPVDLALSRAAGETIYDSTRQFTERGDDIFILNVSFNYKLNRKKTRHEFKLELKNATNHSANIMERYNKATREIEYAEQLSIFPNVYYILYF